MTESVLGDSVYEILEVPTGVHELVEVNGSGLEILEVALQGPPGPAGPSGAAGITVTAGESLGGHRAVVLDADELAWYADNTDAQHLGRVVGITLSAAVSGADATLQSAGYIIEPSWTWTPYQPVYLSTNGLLTQTPPTTGFMQVLGVALSATSLFIQLRDPIVII